MNSSMTSRERILTALDHRQPDHVPIDIGGSSVSTIIGNAYERLKKHLGITGETIYMKEKSRTAILDERIATRLNSDTRPLLMGKPDGWDDIFYENESFQDEFQVIWRKAENGHYAPLGNPLRNAITKADIDEFSWPDPLNPGRFRGLRERAKSLYEQTDYAVLLTLPLGFVHLSQYLRGYQEFLEDTLLNPDLISHLMDRCLEWWIINAGKALEVAEPYVDVVLFGDDVAFQDRPMLKHSFYRKLIKPCHKQMVDFVKAHSRAKIVYHCDGAVTSLMEDFIDIGFDALNPIQVSALGMDDTASLKRSYGDRICFWGGIDTSRVLPKGSPTEVREEVHRRIRDLSPGGGFVLASVHNIQEDVPPENILAMAEDQVHPTALQPDIRDVYAPDVIGIRGVHVTQ